MTDAPDLDLETLFDAAVHVFGLAVSTGRVAAAEEALAVAFELAAAMEGGNHER